MDTPLPPPSLRACPLYRGRKGGAGLQHRHVWVRATQHMTCRVRNRQSYRPAWNQDYGDTCTHAEIYTYTGERGRSRVFVVGIDTVLCGSTSECPWKTGIQRKPPHPSLRSTDLRKPQKKYPTGKHLFQSLPTIPAHVAGAGGSQSSTCPALKHEEQSWCIYIQRYRPETTTPPLAPAPPTPLSSLLALCSRPPPLPPSLSPFSSGSFASWTEHLLTCWLRQRGLRL